MLSEEKELITRFNVSQIATNTDLLEGEDIQFLLQHSDDFEHRFQTRSIFRSKFEMEASVLNDDVHPTPDSKYWQAIGEQNVHLSELVSLIYQNRKMQKDTELKDIDIEEANLQLKRLLRENVNLCEKISKLTVEVSIEDADRLDELPILINRKEKEIEKLELELEEQRFNIKQSHKIAQERIREIKEWESIISSLTPLLEFGIDNFELHHPKRYLERYGRRAMRLDILNQDDKENVVSHFLSFASQPENRELAKTYLRHMIVDNQMPLNHGLVRSLQERIGQPDIQLLIKDSSTPMSLDKDYGSREEANKDDPVINNFFVRKTLKILLVSPHRTPSDRMVMDLWKIQTPAAFDCQIWEPHSMSVSEARTVSIRKAIAEGYDFVQWVDDDLIFPRNALVKLIKHEADIVGGFYYRKYLPLESCGMHDYEVKGRMVPKPIDNFKIGDVIHNTLVLPSGASLINLDVFRNSKMEEPWYRTVSITGVPAITEDTYFCQKAKLAGYDIITDLGVQCIHVDLASNKIYGHPEIVDMDKNIILDPNQYCI